MVQLRLINKTSGEIWDFYLNPSTTEYTFPPELISPVGTRYCAEIRVFTSEFKQSQILYRTVEPLLKDYWQSKGRMGHQLPYKFHIQQQKS